MNNVPDSMPPTRPGFTNSDLKPEFTSPIAANCQARRIPGVVGFSECVTSVPDNCTYLVTFPRGSLCRHPDHGAIALMTSLKD